MPAATKKSAAGDRQVTRTVTVPVKDVTIDDILAAATDVGAPNTARVSTGNAGYNPNPDGTPTEYNHTATYTWTEAL